MKLLRRFLAPLLALCFALTSAPVGALPPARTAAILSGVQGWSFPGSSADLYFARNGGSCTINRLLKPCASLLTTTRASTGYAQWADGHLSSFAANVPRITDLGLLVEQAATNLALQSGAFSNAAWNVSSARPTIVTTNETAPDGTATAVRATVSSVNNRFAQGVTVTNNQPVTFTVWVKAAPSSSAVNVRLASNNGAAWNTGGDAVVALTSSWQRLTMEYQNSFGTGVTLFVGAVKSDSTNDATCYGDVLIWGGQFEANSTFATSYIPTTTVAVARAADVISLTGAASTAALAAKAAYVQSNLVAGGTLPRLLHYSGGAFMDYASTTTTLISNATNTATATMGSGSYTGLVHNSYGMGPASITAISNNGTKATSANAWAANTGTVYVGSNNGSNALNGYMPRLALGAAFGQFDGVSQ